MDRNKRPPSHAHCSNDPAIILAMNLRVPCYQDRAADYGALNPATVKGKTIIMVTMSQRLMVTMPDVRLSFVMVKSPRTRRIAFDWTIRMKIKNLLLVLNCSHKMRSFLDPHVGIIGVKLWYLSWG